MSDGYTVQLQALSNAIEQADAAASQIKATLAALESDIQRTLANWTGDAVQAYRTRKAQWDSAAADIPNQLTAARQTIENIADQYDAAEKAAINAFMG